MKSQNPKSVVFITGAFITHLGWNNWKKYFEENGYTCFVPPWPHKADSPEKLRRKHPDLKDLTELRLSDVIDYYQDFITSLPQKPVIIGHSTGGLIVQVLLQRGVAAAGIAIHSVPAQGVLSFEYSFLKALWAPLGLFQSTAKPYLMTFGQWQYAFTNGMSLRDQEESYQENVIPESRKLLRDCLSSVARVDFKKPHPPLLFISGSTDHIIPASLNYKNFKRYRKNGSVTDYKEFPGKNHYVLGLSSWMDEALFSKEWIEKHFS